MYLLKMFDNTKDTNKDKEPPIPELFFEYGVVADWESHTHVTPEMVNKLEKELIPELKALWSEKGKPLLLSTVNKVKVGFHRKEETACLVLQDRGPESFPFLLSARRQLRLPDEFQRSREFFVFIVNVLFLLRYLYKNFRELDTHSKLLKKYEKEPEQVKNLLFPYALTAYAYNENKRTSELQKVISTELDGYDFQRAWEIIGIEGYEPFLNELLNYEKLIHNSKEANLEIAKP